MQYSDDFKSRCLKEFHNWEMIKDALDKNSQFVGRILSDSCPTGSEAIELSKLVLTDIFSAKELAQKFLIRQKLYAEWCDNYHK